MKDVIRVMAKEVRRIRVLAEISENYELSTPFAKQADSTKRMLAMLIKIEMYGKSSKV